MVRHSMIQECDTLPFTLQYSTQHIARFFIFFLPPLEPLYQRRLSHWCLKHLSYTLSVPHLKLLFHPMIHIFYQKLFLLIIFICLPQMQLVDNSCDFTFTKVFLSKYSLAPNHPVWNFTQLQANLENLKADHGGI